MIIVLCNVNVGEVTDKRPVAQLAECRSPKPKVGGSMPSWPAIRIETRMIKCIN